MVVVYFIAWLVGIYVASLLPFLASIDGFLIGGSVCCVLFAIGLKRHRPVSLTLLFLLLGALRFSLILTPLPSNHIAHLNDSGQVTLHGVVVAEPAINDRSIALHVAVTHAGAADDNASLSEATGLALVQAPRYPEIQYGDRIEATGRLSTPPSDGDFNYQAYLARRDIHSILSWPTVHVVESEQGHPARAAILRFKQRAIGSIRWLVREPAGSLLSGILLGNDNGLPPDLQEDFRTTGMSHIIAISGFNIAILAAIFVHIGDFLFGKRWSVLFALGGITAYTILVGADAAVVRAAIMGSLFLATNRFLGRRTLPIAGLLLTAVLMTLHNPYALWEVGFQLSFAATLSLMLYAEPLTQWVRQRLLTKLRRATVQRLMGLLSDTVLVTLAAQVLTLPLMMATFGQLSLISLLANILILPAQPAVMLWGGLTTLLGMLSPTLAQPIGWVAWLFLTYSIELVRLLANVPWATVPVAFGPGMMVGCYGILGVGTVWLYRPVAHRQSLNDLLQAARDRLETLTENLNLSQLFATASAIAAILLLTWGIQQPDGQLHVTFLDVDQGDAILVQTPTGRTLLIDGGQFPSMLNDQLGNQLPFWQRHLDIVVATHPDADHVAGLPGLFERYTIDKLLVAQEAYAITPHFDALLTAAESQSTAVVTLTSGQQLDLGDGVQLVILHPHGALDPDNRNNNSLVMRLTYRGFSLLLTGDAELEAEKEMLTREEYLNAVVLKVGHHGAQNASSMTFLRHVSAQVAVVSAGRDNRFGHPHPETVARLTNSGASVLTTAELGTIELITDGHLIWLQASSSRKE